LCIFLLYLVKNIFNSIAYFCLKNDFHMLYWSIVKYLSSSTRLRLQSRMISLTFRSSSENIINFSLDLHSQLFQNVHCLHCIYQLFRSSHSGNSRRNIRISDNPGHSQLRHGTSKRLSNLFKPSESLYGSFFSLSFQKSMKNHHFFLFLVVSSTSRYTIIILSCQNTTWQGRKGSCT